MSPSSLVSKACLFLAFMLSAAMSNAAEPGHEYDGVKLEEEKALQKEVVSVALKIYPDQVVKSYDKRMFGVTAHTSMPSPAIDRTFLAPGIDSDKGMPVIAKDTLALLKDEGFRMPLVHLFGEGCAFKWKEQLGPVEGRPFASKKARQLNKKVKVGIVEYIKLALEVDPKAEFAVHVNMLSDTPETSADLVQFLQGDKSTPWGKRRIELGIASPIKVAIWNLDGEYDWQDKWTPEYYVEKAKLYIAAIRSVDPKAQFSAQSASCPWEQSNKDKWRVWNRMLLNELGKDIDYFAWHPYYHGCSVAYLANSFMDKMLEDIKNCPNPDIKIFVSEYASWPPGYLDKDWSKYWFWTHALKGCINTAEWINVMLNRPDVAAMCYHSLSAGPWKMVDRDGTSGKVYVTGIVDLLKMYQSIPGERVVKTEAAGKFSDIRKEPLYLSAVSVAGSDGKLYVFLNNRSPDISGQFELNVEGKVCSIDEVSRLVAPELSSINTVANRSIRIETDKGEAFIKDGKFTLPPKTFALLKISLKDK